MKEMELRINRWGDHVINIKYTKQIANGVTHE